jgi:hypothetical protein
MKTHGGGAVAEFREAFHEKGLKPLRDFRGGVDQAGQLLDQRGDDGKDQQDRRQHRHQRDGDRGPDARQARAFQPVGDGVKEIGDGAAHKEGQHHIAQGPKQDEEDRSRDPPVYKL